MEFGSVYTSASFVERRNFFFYILWSTLLFLLIKNLIGNYCEVYEFIHPATLSGKLMDGVPANIIYPIANVGLGSVYALLYSFSPDVPWYDLFMALFMILSTAVIFAGIHNVLSGKVRPAVIVFMNTALFLIFIADNIVNWNITRGAFMSCIAASFWFILLLMEKPSSFQLLSKLLLNATLFAIGVMIRPEVGELIFIILLGWLFCFGGLRLQIWIRSLHLFIPVILIVGYVTVDRFTSTEFYMNLQPATEYQIALGDVVEVGEMKTPEDSMKYLALRAGIVNDPNKINYQFVQKIVGDKGMFRFNRNLYNRAKAIIFENLNRYNHILPLALLTLVLGVGFFWTSKRQLLPYIGFHLFFWSIFFAISYFMTMENRLTAPLLFFYTISSFIFLTKYDFLTFLIHKIFIRNILLVALLLSVTFSLVHLIESGKKYEQEVKFHQFQYSELKKVAENKLLVPDASGFMALMTGFKPFQTPDYTAFKKVFFFDIETLSLTPAYSSFLDKNCNCNSKDMGSFFDYLYTNRDEVVFVGELERLKLFESYLQVVHKRKYSFKANAQLSHLDRKQENMIYFFSLK